MATITHYCLQSIDLCVFVLLELEQRGSLPEGAHEHYLTRLGEFNTQNVAG